MTNTQKIIAKLRFVEVFEAALLVAHDEWKQLYGSVEDFGRGQSRSEWTEGRAVDLVKELRGHVS